MVKANSGAALVCYVQFCLSYDRYTNCCSSPILLVQRLRFTLQLTLASVLFGVVMFNDTPVEASRKDILIYILGVLSAIASQIVSYYFGSSAGSKEKTDALKGAMK